MTRKIRRIKPVGYATTLGALQLTIVNSDSVNASSYPTLQLAATAATAANKKLIIQTNITVAANTTLDCEVEFVANGRITVSSGITATFTNSVVAPFRQIFFGTGTVTGIKSVYYEWFGAVGDGVTDDAAAINKAHRCVEGSRYTDGIRPTINLLSDKDYGIASRIFLRPTDAINPIWQGGGNSSGGSRFVILPSFTGSTIAVQLEGSTDSIARLTDYELKDFAIVGSSSGVGTATIGLQIGSNDAASRLDGTSFNELKNITIEGFITNERIVHARKVKHTGVSLWNQSLTGAVKGVEIVSEGGFTGDVVYEDDCEIVTNDNTNTGSKPISITVASGDYNNSTGANSVSGIHFGNADIYGGDTDVYIKASNGGRISDLKFNKTQFDKLTKSKFWIESEKTTATTPIVENIEIDGAYLQRSSEAAIVLTSTGTGGQVRNINIHDNVDYDSQKEFVKIGGVAGGVNNVRISNNDIINANYHATTSDAVIDLGSNPTNILVNGNSLSRTDGTSYPSGFIKYTGTATNCSFDPNYANGLCANFEIKENSVNRPFNIDVFLGRVQLSQFLKNAATIADGIQTAINRFENTNTEIDGAGASLTLNKFITLKSGVKLRNLKLTIPTSINLTGAPNYGGNVRAISGDGITNIGFEDVELIGQSGVVANFAIKDSSNITIKNFKTHGFNSAGGQIFNSSNIYVDKIEAYSNTGDGFAIGDGSHNFIVQNCWCYSNGDWGFAFTNQTYAGRVSNNIFENNTSTGTGADECYDMSFIANTSTGNEHGIRIARFGATTDLQRFITVIGNVCRNNTKEGITAENCTSQAGITISGNTLSGNLRSVLIADTQGFVINGNYCLNSVQENIALSSYTAATGRGTIVGNTVDGGTYGIRQLNISGSLLDVSVFGNEVVNQSVAQYSGLQGNSMLSFATELRISKGLGYVSANTAASATSGGSALPATARGYLNIYIDGILKKVPYFDA